MGSNSGGDPGNITGQNSHNTHDGGQLPDVRIKIEDDNSFKRLHTLPHRHLPFDPKTIDPSLVIDLISDDEDEPALPTPNSFYENSRPVRIKKQESLDTNMEDLFGSDTEPADKPHNSAPVPQNGSYHGNTNHPANPVKIDEDESESEEEGLFVAQPGEVKMKDGYIDLTSETEEDSLARRDRVAFTQDLGVQVKEEEPGPFQHIPSFSAVDNSRSNGKRPDFRHHDVEEENAKSDDDFEDDKDGQLSDGEERPRKKKRRHIAKKGLNTVPKVPREEVWNLESHERSWDDLQALLKQSALLGVKQEENPNANMKYAMMKVKSRIETLENKLGISDEGADSAAAQGLIPKDQEDVELRRILQPLVDAQGAEQNAENPDQQPVVPNAPKRAKRVSNAKEYWERKYEEAGMAGIDAQTLIKKAQLRHKPGKKGRLSKKEVDAHTRDLINKLRDGDPITARAALGNVPLPGAVVTRNKADQMKQIINSIAENPGGNNDEKAKNAYDKKLLDEATKSFGWWKCRAQDGKWMIHGMKTALYHHQLVGTRWMLGQEFSPDGPYGGILADQMGLGKTVQILATMANNLPGPTNGFHSRATLIIVPATTITQWVSEIEKHTSFNHVVFTSKEIKNPPGWRWYDCDIILVSYSTVALGHPSDEKLKRFASMKLNNEAWAEEFDKELGNLYRYTFHRVILDEAHAIKNHHSRTSKACIALSAKHRWALTGTPIHNSIDELYPYMRFLGADWAAPDFATFKENFGNIDDDTVQKRLAAFIPSIMLRRRVDENFLGHPILEIPRTHPVEKGYIDLSIEERLFYGRLESRFRDNISQHIQAGSDSKKTRAYLAYLSRLRQAVAHPFLLETPMKNDFTLEDLHWLREQLRQQGGRIPLCLQLQKWIEMVYEGDQAAGLPFSFGTSNYGYLFDIDEHLVKVHKSKKLKEVICRACYDVLTEETEPQILECGHTYCQECLVGLVDSASEHGKHPKCHACNALIHDPKVLTELADGPNDEDEPEPEQRKRGSRKKKEHRDPGDDHHNTQPKSKPESSWLKQWDKHPELPMTPGAKTTVVKNKVLEWQTIAPNDKIIIFTQWVLMGRILGRILEGEDIRFLYYFGDLSKDQRHAAVKAFHDDASVKVLIASTRCGGQALNLTCANRVILADLWWNSAVERQAFGRVHRIGQKKETYFFKVICKNTIDERLEDMQEEKEKFVNRTLNDDYSNARKNITLPDLKKLFGMPDTGRPDNEQAGQNHPEVQKKKGKGKGKVALARGVRKQTGGQAGSNLLGSTAGGGALHTGDTDSESDDDGVDESDLDVDSSDSDEASNDEGDGDGDNGNGGEEIVTGASVIDLDSDSDMDMADD